MAYIDNLKLKRNRQKAELAITKARIKLAEKLREVGFDKDRDIEHLVEIGETNPTEGHELVMETMQNEDPEWAFDAVMEIVALMVRARDAWDKLDQVKKGRT